MMPVGYIFLFRLIKTNLKGMLGNSPEIKSCKVLGDTSNQAFDCLTMPARSSDLDLFETVVQ